MEDLGQYTNDNTESDTESCALYEAAESLEVVTSTKEELVSSLGSVDTWASTSHL